MRLCEVAYGSPGYNECKQLRHEVLRVPLGLALSDQDIAGEESQIHLAAYEGETLAGLLILKPLAPQQVKFRQMAVAPHFQGKGLGRSLMEYGEAFARKRGWFRIELHARVYAKPFYEKLGYLAQGDEFTEVTIPTVKMVKQLRE